MPAAVHMPPGTQDTAWVCAIAVLTATMRGMAAGHRVEAGYLHLSSCRYLVTVRVAGAEADPANPRPPKKRAVRA